MTIDTARETLKNPLYYGAMMVKCGDVDGMVAGAANSTADTLRCCLQIIKTAPGIKLFSTCTVMVIPNPSFGSNGVVIFTDTSMYENPTADELSQIALSAASFFKTLTGDEPRVAMLSHSTKGSVKSIYTEKVISATKLVQEKYPDLIIDGELQFDAAVVPSISQLKAPGSKIAGQANVLVFPDLASANIGCKIAERFGNAELYGPVSQGLARPINDLSRGCSVRDIVGMVAITALQAQKM
jgi:phosphate acetyltransferase